MLRRAFRQWSVAVGVTAAAVPVSAQVELPEPVYLVSMAASIEPDDQQLRGTEWIRWRNTSSAPVEELQFHLYLNAFANNRSTFMAESGGQLRGIEIPDEGWGWIEVETMRLAYGAELVAAGAAGRDQESDPFRRPFVRLLAGDVEMGDLEGRPDLKQVEQFISPDDGNAEDRTVARYPLPQPLQPGEWVELEVEFRARLPRIFARTGVHKGFILGGQWFPKIGVFEEAGERGRDQAGWNTHQFHAHSEFYADFGDYYVRLDLPASYAGRIGATGRLLDESVEGDRVTAHFGQRGVHDFAWTADPRFLVVEDRFDPDTDVPKEQTERIATLLGVSPEALRLQPVEIRLLLQPAHRALAGRYMDAIKAAFRGYGLRLGAYPYETLTVVDPPRGGMGAAGMEYQTFITGGAHPLVRLPGFTKLPLPEAVTVHELGHNFFQGMIASNEFEEAWIDEGINSFYDSVVMEERYGATTLFGLRLPPGDTDRLQLRDGWYTDSIVQPSWSYATRRAYGFNSYSRAALTLAHLEKLMGEATFARAMRRFFQTWRFRHPSTADFEEIILEEATTDVSWFLEQALHSDRGLDYRVASARSRRHGEPRGWFWQEDGEIALAGAADRRGGDSEDEAGGEDVDEAAAEEEGEDDKDEKLYLTEVRVERHGEFVHPVTVELVFEDGERVRHEWDGASRWVRYREVRAAKLLSAQVDPDDLLILDANPLNNSIRLKCDRRPVAKLIAHLVFWLQNVLQLTAMVG